MPEPSQSLQSAPRVCSHEGPPCSTDDALCFSGLPLAAVSGAGGCEEITEPSATYIACRFDPGRDEIRLHLSEPDGVPYGGFAGLRRQLWAERRVLTFAMNAGMYHDDLSPVGYFAEYGKVLKPAVTGGGRGNFHLLPNGVFLMKDGKAAVVETKRFPGARRDAGFRHPIGSDAGDRRQAASALPA